MPPVWREGDRLVVAERDGLKKGIVTLCIGGGQCIALAFEVL